MPLKDYAKRSAIAAKYGWQIMGWAVDLDNPAGITLQSQYDSTKFLRFKHKDSLTKWEAELAENKQVKPKRYKPKPLARTFDDVVAENAKLKAKLAKLEGKRRGK